MRVLDAIQSGSHVCVLDAIQCGSHVCVLDVIQSGSHVCVLDVIQSGLTTYETTTTNGRLTLGSKRFETSLLLLSFLGTNLLDCGLGFVAFP